MKILDVFNLPECGVYYLGINVNASFSRSIYFVVLVRTVLQIVIQLLFSFGQEVDWLFFLPGQVVRYW